MNIIKNLIERIEKMRCDSRNPVKSYKSYENAEKAAEKMLEEAKQEFDVPDCGYIIFYNPHWERYCVAFDLTGMLAKYHVGGFIGIFAVAGFISY